MAHVRHEQVGPPRHWATDEQDFASSVADQVRLALEGAERMRRQVELITGKRYRAHLGRDPGSGDPIGTYYFEIDGGKFHRVTLDFGPPDKASGIGIYCWVADVDANGWKDIVAPGLLERVYEVCLTHELRKRGLTVETQVDLPVIYDGVRFDAGMRIDLVVDGKLLIELKAVETMHPVHRAQLLTYLKLTGHRLGLLINFNVPLIRDGIERLAL